MTVQPDFAQFASQMARHPHTLAQLRELMRDAERKRAIGERIKALRERRGFTQPQLMEVAGLEASHFRNLQNWEAGGGTNHENYERLAEALGCSYDYLMTGAEIGPPPEDILGRLDAYRKRLRLVERKLDQVLDILAPDAAVQAATDAAQPTPEADPRSVPEPASSARKKVAARPRAARR
jgi:transcriptional regulator with XRE-family HTH domain